MNKCNKHFQVQQFMGAQIKWNMIQSQFSSESDDMEHG